MDYTQEIAQLVVVVLPVATIAITNLVLALSGESGTLLLPAIGGW